MQVTPQYPRGHVGGRGGVRGSHIQKSGKVVKRLDRLAPNLVYVCEFIWEWTLVQSEEGVRNQFLISASICKKMRRNRKSMLTDRPDVPRTPFGRLKPPNRVFGGKHENAPTI